MRSAKRYGATYSRASDRDMLGTDEPPILLGILCLIKNDEQSGIHEYLILTILQTKMHRGETRVPNIDRLPIPPSTPSLPSSSISRSILLASSKVTGPSIHYPIHIRVIILYRTSLFQDSPKSRTTQLFPAWKSNMIGHIHLSQATISISEKESSFIHVSPRPICNLIEYWNTHHRSKLEPSSTDFAA